MNVCCVIAHQDDEMGCTGTLLRLKRERSATLTLITLTNGDKGAAWDPERPLPSVAEERHREMREEHVEHGPLRPGRGRVGGSC